MEWNMDYSDEAISYVYEVVKTAEFVLASAPHVQN